MTRLAALALLLCASCDDMQFARRGEVAEADLNARIALDRAERLERQLRELEDGQRQLKAMDRAIADDLGSLQNTMNNNVDIYNAHVREYRQHTH